MRKELLLQKEKPAVKKFGEVRYSYIYFLGVFSHYWNYLECYSNVSK